VRVPLIAEVLPHTRHLPFEPLLSGPTVVEPLDDPALVRWLGRRGVFVKRDDQAHPLYGGNKVRKFEWLLGAARAEGATTLVTLGGIASTQVTATATLGKLLGYRVEAVLFDQPMTAFAKQALLANHAAGAEQIYGGALLPAVWRARARFVRPAPGERPFAVFPGASTPLPNLGFVDAALEVAEQVRRGEAPKPDVVVVPAGSCGTAAALALGFRLVGWDTEVLAVRIGPRYGCNEALVALVDGVTRRALARRRPGFEALLRGRARVVMDHSAAGGGYGVPTDEAREGATMLAAITGCAGEITYTGKALAALRRTLGGRHRRSPTVWLWNTLTTQPPTGEGLTRDDLPAELAALFARPLVA
jgi:D-cysteine desulfhydrase